MDKNVLIWINVPIIYRSNSQRKHLQSIKWEYKKVL